MPTLCLPSRPSLDDLKGQARTLQRQVRAGEKAALDTVRAFHPRPAVGQGPEHFPLADAQLVIARQYGFALAGAPPPSGGGRALRPIPT